MNADFKASSSLSNISKLTFTIEAIYYLDDFQTVTINFCITC